MKRRIGIGIGIIFIILVVVGVIANYYDGGRVTNGQEPKLCIKITSDDGRKITYWGLGYKVIRYVSKSPLEPYENNIGVKMGSWFMKYELPIDSGSENKISKEINNIDDFYNVKATKGNDIRNLGKNYSVFDAQKDNCFVISGAKVFNDNVYSEFLDNYQNKKTTFMRMALTTDDGDLILYDVLYFENSNEIYCVADYTRDNFSSQDDRKITISKYKEIGTYIYKGNSYLILFNDKVTDIGFESEDIFILAKIN